jgi:anti-sigma factor RsiW
MKLVETDTEGPEPAQPSAAPRPEHRRVAVSFFLTAFVLIATVVTVYALFPERHNALLTRAMEVHRENEPDIVKPSMRELAAWSAGVLGNNVPWPEDGGFEILGVRRVSVLRRAAAVVYYRVGKDRVTLMAQRARDTPPRKYRRREDGLMAVSWRRGKWTFIAVGPVETIGSWGAVFKVP